MSFGRGVFASAVSEGLSELCSDSEPLVPLADAESTARYPRRYTVSGNQPPSTSTFSPLM